MNGLHSYLPTGVSLVVKASCDDSIKRIRFAPDVTKLQFCEFQEKIAKALLFDHYDFKITWEDDDGEHCDITSTDDLQEALFYFCPSEVDTTCQSLNMRVSVRVDAKVSLSDYGSSVCGESDDEGTIASMSSRSAINMKSSIRSKIYSNGNSASRTSEWGRSFTIPPSFKQSFDNPISKEKKASACHNGWGSASCSRWFHTKCLAASTRDHSDQSSYAGTISSLQSLSLRGKRSDRDKEGGSSGDESGDSAHTRGPNGRCNRKRSDRVNDQNLRRRHHHGVTCRSCQTSPISGIRYFCASCAGGADFCSDCETSGYALKSGFGHEMSHVVLRLTEPLDTFKAIEILTASLFEAQKRLIHDNRPTCTQDAPILSNVSDVSVDSLTDDLKSAIKCSFCIAPIVQGPRYLCANCPLVSPSSMEGFLLCSDCQVHSLQCHDPSHFFIKINKFGRSIDMLGRTPLGERWIVQEATKGVALLPPLYAVVEQRDSLRSPLVRSASDLSIRIGDGLLVTDDTAQNKSTRDVVERIRAQEIETASPGVSQSRSLVPLDRLVHPSILCDNCFSVIHGVWYRCCHCTTSFDLCEACEGQIVHDPSHSFAVFKQPVDLDLFKSCVDHQDAGEGVLGASRPMLSFPLL